MFLRLSLATMGFTYVLIPASPNEEMKARWYCNDYFDGDSTTTTAAATTAVAAVGSASRVRSSTESRTS